MVLAQCDEPGMSVAQVAMSHGINDNVVHRWRQLARQQPPARQTVSDGRPSVEPPVAFVPLALPAPAPEEPRVRTEVRLDIKRGAVSVGVAWPEKSLGDLAGFVRELLK
jgi:transposase